VLFRVLLAFVTFVLISVGKCHYHLGWMSMLVFFFFFFFFSRMSMLVDCVGLVLVE
jgi:hypothetical protein